MPKKRLKRRKKNNKELSIIENKIRMGKSRGGRCTMVISSKKAYNRKNNKSIIQDT